MYHRADDGGMLSGTGECAAFERAEKVCFALFLFQFETNICFAQEIDEIYSKDDDRDRGEMYIFVFCFVWFLIWLLF